MKRSLLLIITLTLGFVLFSQASLFENQDPGQGWDKFLSQGYFPPEPKQDPRLRPGFTMAVHDSTHSYDVRFYRLGLNMGMTGPQFSGNVFIYCTSNQNGLNLVSLDYVELTVDSVRVNGSAVSYDTGGEKIDIDVGPYSQGQNFQILVGYHGIANTTYGGGWFPAGLSYFRRGQYSAPETTAFSMAEPSDARRWFPCYDEPWDKADSCRIDATIPKRYQVASNGFLTGVDTVGDWATYHWLETHPISTYLMSVAISKYAILHGQSVINDDTIPIMHFVYRADSAEAANGYQTVPDMIYFYSDTFCLYPFAKYGMATVEPFGGGMEHQTMTSILAYYGWEEGFAHELAHMWWGDMITCADWPSIWINEGFATYTEALWTEHAYGTSAFKSEMIQYGNEYFSQASSYDFPIYDPPLAELFNYGIIYCKAGWILHMLRRVLGETDFWGIWPVYADSFKYGNANTEDFKKIGEQVSGEDLDWFFQEWIYDLGYPYYQYGWRVVDLGSNNYRLDVQLRQTQAQGPVFRMPLDFRFRGGSVDTICTGIDSLTFQEFRFEISAAQPPDSLVLDPNNWVLEKHTKVPYAGVGDDYSSNIPVLCDLGQGYPNPMSKSTQIEFMLNQDMPVQLTIYNLLGQTITTLVNKKMAAGQHRVYWDGRDQRGNEVGSGVYFYKMNAGEFSDTKRLVLIR